MRLYSRFLSDIPAWMSKVQAPATVDELELAHQVRSRFLLPGWPNPYLNNVARVLRLFEGVGTYLEVNSRDKGFIAQVAGQLAPDATLVDVDLIRYPDNEQLLLESLLPAQKLVRVEVDPEGEKAPEALLSQVGARRFDVAMINTGTTMDRVLFDFSVYFEFVKPGGLLIMNDVCWEGDQERRGNFHALSLVNAQLPVYCVHMDEPVHRLAPREAVGGEWGTLGGDPAAGDVRFSPQRLHPGVPGRNGMAMPEPVRHSGPRCAVLKATLVREGGCGFAAGVR